MDCRTGFIPRGARAPLGLATVVLLFSAVLGGAQPVSPRPREFRPGAFNGAEDLPLGRFRTRLETLPVGPRLRAIGWLRNFHFTELDLKSLQMDAEGGVFYADAFSPDPAALPAEAEPVLAQAAVPVTPFPASLIFHSKPGSPNVLYLNFTGETVSGTVWNNSLGRTTIPAVPFSTDSDFSTFSDAEQTAIKQVWQRVAEDYAPFNIDVTTERPAVFGTRTAHALITRNTDANGNANPSSMAGGVGYVNVFGQSNYALHRPSWIYVNNLGNSASATAEAASHEIGHNLGLSHDGQTDGTEYYTGHGSGNTSWAPIMGAGYGRNVTQWSKGDYYLANNTQDDLATIAAKISYRSDDRGDGPAAPTPLVITGGTNVVSTTPENDPTDANPANKGIIERNTDVDVFSFTTGNGPISLAVTPWTMTSGTRGGNLDVVIELRQTNGTLILTNNPVSQTSAQIQTTLAQGTYHLYVRNTGVGDPFSSSPGGYTAYGSIGQYFINGHVAPAGGTLPAVQLVATANPPAGGAVNPPGGTYVAGATVQVSATAATYYRFVGWTNGVIGTNNPLILLLNSNVSIQAVFAEILTTNHPTPYAWLASYGYTSNFENVAEAMGANGIPFWQSYIAGLNPNDPTSQLRLSLRRSGNQGDVLNWNTVTGRLYTLWWKTNLARPFASIPGATELPASIHSFTNTPKPTPPAIFYRVEVQQPDR